METPLTIILAVGLITSSIAVVVLFISNRKLRLHNRSGDSVKNKPVANEKLLRKIAENFPNSYISIIEPDFTIGYTAGKEFQEQGIDPNQFVGKTIEDVFGVHSPVVREQYQKTFKGEESRFELTINNQIQSYKTVPLHADDGSIPHILVVVENITDQRKHELKYSQILNTAIDAFGIVNAEGRIVEANEAASRLLGYTREELADMTVFEIEMVDSPEVIAQRIQHIKEQGTGAFESKHRRKDGQLIDVEISASYLPIQDGLVITFIRDITEKKRDESEREITLKLLSHLSSPNSIREFMSEVTKLMRDWSGCEAVGIRLQEGDDYPYFESRGFPAAFVEAESQLCRCDDSGQIIRDSIGNPVLECMCGNVIRGRFNPELPFFTEFGSFWTNSTTDLLAGTSEDDRQARTRNRCHGEGYESVALIPLNYMNECLGLLQFNDSRRNVFHERDIYQFERLATNLAMGLMQRKGAQALRESEENFRTYVSNAPHAIFVVDDTGRYIDVNQSACAMTGYTRGELLDMSIPDLTAERLEEGGLERFNRLKKTGILRTETRIRHKNGSVILIHMDGVCLKNNRFMSLCVDITEKRRLEELESRAQRLAMAGSIAGQVAHDFNNLLAPVMAYPEFIREELSHDNVAHAYLDAIESAAKNIANINQDLLTMGRRGHFSQDVLDLNRILLQVINEMEQRAKSISFDLHLCPELMKIKGGAAQIHRALINLIANAQDAQGGVGTITITSENYYADQTSVAFGCIPKGEYVKLTITDHGCGIDEDVLQNIFDPFFTTKTADKKRGSGLGLSVVDAVIKDHSGFIDLHSRVGAGTSFYLYFPVTREKIREDKIVDACGGSETILVVDDDDIQREVSSKLLKRLGYKVQDVDSGEDAVKLLRETPKDIVILDMVMPGGIDGTETYRQIRELYPNQKAIILSGFSESDRVVEVQKLGAGAFVKKPVTLSKLAAAVRNELDRTTVSSRSYM